MSASNAMNKDAESTLLPAVASVVLNYRSEEDLRVIVPQLVAQQGLRHLILIVDNASGTDAFDRFEDWLSEQSFMSGADASGPRLLLMRNSENLGYSAGNNVGMRMAISLGCESVLITNPDMRIEDRLYVRKLADCLRRNRNAALVGSLVIGPDGVAQSPLREGSFLEELLWPLVALRARLRRGGFVLDMSGRGLAEVPKISGCCFMARSQFMEEIGFLDENVFLYCEESILASKVKGAGFVVLCDPTICAVHHHIPSEKSPAETRVQAYLRSRDYYLKRYSGYGPRRLAALRASYALLGWFHRARALIRHAGVS